MMWFLLRSILAHWSDFGTDKNDIDILLDGWRINVFN